MDIKATYSSPIQIQSVEKLHSVLQKIDSSLFKAIIAAQVGKGEFLAKTPAGDITLKSQLSLQLGDELSLKKPTADTSASTSLELLKITRQPLKTSQQLNSSVTSSILLSNTNDIKNLQQLPQHFIAKVLQIDKQEVKLIDLKGQQFNLSKESFNTNRLTLKQNDMLVFKQQNALQVEIRPISKKQLLQQVQLQILPKQNNHQELFNSIAKAVYKFTQSIEQGNKLQQSPSKTPLATQTESIHTPKVEDKTFEVNPNKDTDLYSDISGKSS